MDAQAVEELDRTLGVCHPDVDVQGEGRLAASDPAHRPVHEPVALARRDPGVLGHLARMHARRRGRETEGARGAGQPRAQEAQFGDRAAHRGMRAGVELDRRLVRLGRAVSRQVVAEQHQHPIGALSQPPTGRIEEHHLLLEAHGVRSRRLPGRPLDRVGGSGQLSRHGALSRSQSERCCPP
jgi:hypothetical protein